MNEMSTRMDQLDEHDIREAFQVLDADCDGTLTADEFYTLYLGLGFRPERLDMEGFKRMLCDEDTRLTVGTVVSKLAKFSRNRRSVMEEAFALLDESQKGFVGIEDLQRLWRQEGSDISASQSVRLLSKFGLKDRIDFETFCKLMEKEE